jgi:FixJ family two-component response regulator
MHSTRHTCWGPKHYTAHETPIVYMVGSEPGDAESLDSSICSRGWGAQIAMSAEEFLARPRIPAPSCLLLEADLPGLSSLELQAILADQLELPIIFMSNHADTQTAVQAMKAGAFEFLLRPCPAEVIMAAVAAAIGHSQNELHNLAQMRSFEERYESLSRRERDVMKLVVAGRLNKHIALDLRISEVTVKVHRGRVMRKMRAGSLAELVFMSAMWPHSNPALHQRRRSHNRLSFS